MGVLTDLKPCLKAIEDCHLHKIDITTFTNKFLDDPPKVGDHLQYALHKFCKQNENNGLDEKVVKLSCLCYSKESVLGFCNMTRFLGALFHISIYFLKNEMYGVVLEISKSIEHKKSEIETAALDNQSLRSYLFALHSHFINKAQELSSTVKEDKEVETSMKLADASITFLQLIKMQQLQLGQKIFRNVLIFLNNIKFYDQKYMAEFYKKLENALKNIMPSYRHNDILACFIKKMDSIEGSSEMLMEDFKSYFKRCTHLVAALLNNTEITKLWDSILDFFFVSFQEDEHFKCIIHSVNKIAYYKNSALHFLMLSVIFNYANELWMKVYEHNWSQIVHPKLVQFMYNVILSTTKRCVGNVSQYCRFGDYKVDICFADFFPANLQRILHMIRFCMKYDDKPECLELMEIAREVFRVGKQVLCEMKKECCLSRKKYCWNRIVIRYTNIIEGLMKYSNSSSWKYMTDSAEELICDIINSEFESPLEWKRVSTLFQRWQYATLKLEQYDEALFVSAFYIFSFPNDKDQAMTMWILAKTTTSCEYSQSLTLKDLVDKEGERIKRMNSKCNLSEHEEKELLMMELLAYSSCSPSDFKTPSAMSTLIWNLWNRLKKLHLDALERASALNLVIASTLSSADSASLSEFKKDCEDILHEILKQEGKSNCRALLYSGNLKYCLFLCQLKTVQDYEDEVNTSKVTVEFLRKEEEEKAKFGEVIDLNRTCDVMPSSNRFTVKFEENYLKALNETFTLWKKASEISEISTLEPRQFENWLHNVKQIAHMYYLIGDAHQSFLSWCLYYRIAKICKNKYYILLGISQIISGCVDVENLNLVEEGNEITRELASNKEKDVLVLYWLALASNYLKNKNGNKCLAYLLRVKENIGSIKPGNRAYLFYARYWCLVSKFLCMCYDHMEKFGLKAGTEIRTVVFQAFSYANAATKDGSISSFAPSECCEVLLTMLEVNTWSARLFGFYYQAAFMRLFLDDLYQILQKLILPTRTASILVLLAEVDVMCEKTEAGLVKLKSLKNILDSLPLPSIEEENVERKKSDFLKVPTTAEDEKRSRSPSPARFLTCSDQARECDVSPLSCVVTEDSSIKFPTHAANCECYPCRNLTIRILGLSVLHLEAQLQKLKKSMNASYTFFREGYNWEKKLQSHESELNADLHARFASSLENFNGNFDLESDSVKIISVKFLTSYAYFLLSQSSDENVHEYVAKLIDRIDKIMKSFSYEEKLLQWSVMELKLIAFLMHKRKVEETQQKKCEAAVRSTLAATAKDDLAAKTPFVSRTQAKSVIPAKPKQVKFVRTPNLFAPKPDGRKVMASGADEKAASKSKKQEEEPKRAASKSKKQEEEPKRAASKSKKQEEEPKRAASKSASAYVQDIAKNRAPTKTRARRSQPKLAEIETVELLS